MPTKKSTAVQQAVTSSGAGVGGAPPLDTSDPVMAAVAIVDKKARNLEKRKVCVCVCVGGGDGVCVVFVSCTLCVCVFRCVCFVHVSGH